ncbi:MAG: hypothetical protein Q7U59_04035 [Lutibacter sp.]|jgi:hypothetical protein|nr:hypothetical protein [Lutibacter sp.]MDP3358688.1 hypothetical protein [Lutibacter sp.]
MLLNFILFFLQINIEENIKNAPDKDYETGVIIGTYLPFVLLAALAYFIYYKAKNRKDLED